MELTAQKEATHTTTTVLVGQMDTLVNPSAPKRKCQSRPHQPLRQTYPRLQNLYKKSHSRLALRRAAPTVQYYQSKKVRRSKPTP